ncbi:MAG: hypothetical protein HQ510_13020 [Candidatus Marinimicrobia bacterium]|nr:hypothetical protein [Candidatus Neomarinimicrobiota bacterium]
MNNRLIGSFIIFISLCWSQVAPYDPPLSTIRSGITPYQVSLPVSGIAILNVSVTAGTPQLIDNRTIYQTLIELKENIPLSVTLTGLNVPVGSKCYLRYPNSDQYVGPFYWDPTEQSTEKTIGLITSSSFIVELNLPGYENHGCEVTISSVQTSASPLPEPEAVQKKASFFHSNRDRTPPVILVTGFWPPTNEMIRHFSQSEDLNPGGWQGEDWESSGYDIVSYFPQFTNPDCSDCGQGYGDLEVDYQDTSGDFWPIADNHVPIAIITFSRGWMDNSWEVEYNFFNRTNWIGDYSTPVMPTPNPPDQDEISNFHRYSNLPMENIVSAVDDLPIGLNPYIDWSGDPGHFVSEFMGYHGVWYRDLYAYGEEMCITAGHVHVGGMISNETARIAAEETIRQVIDYLDLFVFTPGDINQDDSINIQDLVVAVNVILGLTELTQAQFYAADVNSDSIVNIQDVIIILNMIINGIPE